MNNIGAHVGRAVTGDAIVGINSGELWINIDPKADYNETVAAVREVVDGYPGQFHDVKTYQPKRIGEVLLGGGNDLTVRVYGHDLDVLRSKAQEVSELISKVDGVVDTKAELPLEEAQIEIEVDLAAAERYQVKPGDVRRAVALLVSGLQVGNLYEEQKVCDVVVWGDPKLRESLTALRDLPIDTPRGQVWQEQCVPAIRLLQLVIVRRGAAWPCPVRSIGIPSVHPSTGLPMRILRTALTTGVWGLLLVCGTSAPLHAGTTGKNAGKVTDASTGEALLGANILVEGTTYGAATDPDGENFIINLPPGIYTLRVRMVGYRPLAVERVRVQVDLTTRVDARLTSETIDLGQEVTVVGRR